MLTCYFRGKLGALGEAISQQDSSGSEGQDGEAMDTSDSPKAAFKLMGRAWVNSLHQIVAYMEQLGLGVCSYATAIVTPMLVGGLQLGSSSA